ncbi:hypothetical protein E4U56_004889 [Claviceps arundinis]|uniref:non-specific serine/threonine protein kinase n=1 Tax=Claviceps arundinis TaxID=1623583 RepID=A0A9P7MLG5_9HYPO|nr:hypothetical protein E4U56_004889 [Claviceps arundinis]
MLLPSRRWKSLFRRWCKSLFSRWWRSHSGGSRRLKTLFSRWWKTLFSCWRKNLFSRARNSSRARKTFFGRAWKPLSFPNEGFAIIPADHKIDEETNADYDASNFYPVKIGEIFRDRYQVVGKLGFGITSTVWLARDLIECRHVTVKIFGESEYMCFQQDLELNAYKRIENAPIDHPGRHALRSLLDSFDIDGPNGRHLCLVHPPLWESVLDLRYRNPVQKLPEPIIAGVLKRLFLALDFLHRECHVAHADIKENNILLEADKAVFRAFEQDELDEPSPRKELDGRTIYASRELNMPGKIGVPVLCDFGSAIPLDDTTRCEKIQPDIYRAPEVILDIPWTSSVDIWNVGCMIWDTFEGDHLFTGHDSEFKTYHSRAHLAEIIALLGPPPPTLLARSSLRTEFFSDAGDLCAGIPIPESRPLEQRLTLLEGEERECFLRFMRKMLQWEPEKRSSAKDLAEDEWILRYHSGR